MSFSRFVDGCRELFILAGIMLAIVALAIAIAAAHELSGTTLGGGAGGVILGASIVALAAVVWFARRMRRREKTVLCRPHGIEVLENRSRRSAFYEWERVRGYDDGATDVVKLVLERGSVLVPTATEEERVTILKVLDAHGVRRCE